ncbi:glycosyltransferase family 2 protein [Escherichia albertii]|nr:glycosyltransferase family 2 protein [Escherichia albertii]
MNERSFGISVVVPVYNRKEKLIRAINSVSSLYPHLVEIIVIDDCSDLPPDSFLEKKNKHGINIRVYRNSYNKGPQNCRNMGIRRAKFNYIAFLDSDDYFCPEKIDWLLNILKHEDIDFFYHAVDGCEKYNRISSYWFNTVGKFVHFKWLLVFLNPCVTPSVVIKKKTCLFNPHLRYSEDYAYFLSYINSKSKVKYFENVYTIVPREIGTKGGISHNIIKMRKGEFYGKKNILRNGKSISNYIRFLISLSMACLRVLADIARRRYTVSDFFKDA